MEKSGGGSRRVALKATGAAGAATIPSGRRRIRRVAATAVAVTVLAGATMATLAPISLADPKADERRATSPRTVQVSGELVPVNLATGAYKMRGELIGTWTFPPAQTKTYYQSPTRLYQLGTEFFEGCVNLNGDDKCDKSEPSGRLQGEYMYWASFDSSGRLIEGACVHALTGGTKAFTGVRGLLHMTDVYASTEAGSTSIYQGEIILNAVDEGPVVKTASVGLGAQASTGSGPAGC